MVDVSLTMECPKCKTQFKAYYRNDKLSHIIKDLITANDSNLKDSIITRELKMTEQPLF